MNPLFRRSLVYTLIVILSLCLVRSAQAIPAGQDQADRLFVFAGSLLQEGDYYRAITEYKRFISYFPEDRRVPLCRLNIGEAYNRGGKTDAAVKEYKGIREDFEGRSIAERASYEIGMAYFSGSRYEESAEAFSEFVKRYPDSARFDAGQAYHGWSLLHLWELDRAARAFSMIREKSTYYVFAQDLLREINTGTQLPRKSPVAAGVMSALLPGAGQAYAGRYNEGLTSFILNGAFIWSIVELFNHSNEVAGLLLGFFEVGWYSGGIFGAVNDAHKFNHKARMDYIDKLQDKFPLPPEK